MATIGSPAMGADKITATIAAPAAMIIVADMTTVAVAIAAARAAANATTLPGTAMISGADIRCRVIIVNITG